LGYVLGDFGKDEKDWLVALLDAVAEAAPLLATDKIPDFMSKVALLTQDTP
jgi:PTH1 family peptidyl-tRNA hydrolase